MILHTILEPVHLPIPLDLMDGGLAYDPAMRTYYVLGSKMQGKKCIGKFVVAHRSAWLCEPSLIVGTSTRPRNGVRVFRLPDQMPVPTSMEVHEVAIGAGDSGSLYYRMPCDVILCCHGERIE